MVWVGNRRVIDYLLDWMWRASVAEIRVVIWFDKVDLIDHCRSAGTVIVDGNPCSVIESVELGVAGIDPDACVLIGFPDTVWDFLDGFARLVDQLGDDCAAVLGLFDAGPDAARSDVVDVDDAGRVVGITPKSTEPESNLIWGCAAVWGAAFVGVSCSGDLSEYLMQLDDPPLGVFLSDYWIDIGTDEALRRANGLAWIQAAGV